MSVDPTRTHTNRKLRCLLHCALYRRTITLTCPQCGHVRRFDALALWWYFEQRGRDDTIPALWRHFHCRSCRRTGNIVRPHGAITTDPPDADQPPYPSEYEWKRQVSRYRS